MSVAGQAKSDQAVNALILIINYPDLAIALLLYAAHAETRTCQHRVKNKHYILHNMSLAIWMLIIAGWIGFHLSADFKRHYMFRVLFKKMQNNVSLDKDNIITYTTHQNRLREHTLSFGNVVVTTVSNFGDIPLYSAFHFQLVIVDEATKATEPNMLNIFGNYPKIPLVMVGNKAQLFPVVISNQSNNSFWRPLRLLFFQRLKILGQPLILLNKQYRMVSKIRSMVSTFFYSCKLVNRSETTIEN